MPCPGCRKMIDARDHLCPYCGIDTDAKLAFGRMVSPLIAVGLLLAVGYLLGLLPRALAFGLVAGTVTLGLVGFLRRRPRS